MSRGLAVFAQVLAGFRYGRDDLDVLGLNFRRDLIDVSFGLIRGPTQKHIHTYTLAETFAQHATHVFSHLNTHTHVQERIQVYPPPDDKEEHLVTLLQVRLMKKLGRNAYPFTFSVSITFNDAILFSASYC